VDVKQLKALVTVAEVGSVTRASELLHLVQPAVTRQIRTARRDNTATSSTTSGVVVLATAAATSGSTGTFTASSLNPSGTWSVTGDSGQFGWSYPIVVPPPASGTVAPQVALSYSSSAVDGRTSSTNNQPSRIGEGWDYAPGYIERSYRQCSDETTLSAAQQTGDLCWAGQIVTMNLGGSTVQLVRDDATGAWHPLSDNGSRVELLTGSGNGALNGEYWKITTTDGAQYFFGRHKGPGYTNQATTNSTWTVPVYGANPGDPCYNASGFAASSCAQAWRWNLDYAEDTHGNVTTYYYTPETNLYGANNGTAGVTYTRGGYLNHIDYGLRDNNGTIHASPAPDQIQFAVAERCIPTSTFSCDPASFTAANASNWPDTPQDQQCLAGTTCNQLRRPRAVAELDHPHRLPAGRNRDHAAAGVLRRADDGQPRRGLQQPAADGALAADQHHRRDRATHDHHLQPARMQRHQRSHRPVAEHQTLLPGVLDPALPHRPDPGLLPQVRRQIGATARP